MSAPETDAATLVECPHCNQKVAARNLERHVKKAHNPDTELKRLISENLVRVQAAREKFLTTIVKCTICRKLIQLKDIKSHYGSSHAKPAPTEMLSFLRETPPKNQFASERERERFWKEKSGYQSEDTSDDVFEKKKVILGGAYGLGKNRKH